MIRKHLYYSGSVQGVGFRYTTVQVAGGYEVTGFVRNMMDGRVEVVVEGEAGQVGAFMVRLAEVMAGHIRECVEHDEPFSGQFGQFGIRF